MSKYPDAQVEFSRFQFSPVIDFPESYEIFDFTQGYDPERARAAYGIGRYNEQRPGMYGTELFASQGGSARRDIHVGIDLAAPAGTPVKAFYAGVIFMTGVNSAPGDYGGTLITQHELAGRTLWALYGHLRPTSLPEQGSTIAAGEELALLGAKEENGGWNPHLHFQLSWQRPERCDLPGVVTVQERALALAIYPDPRLVLGPLY